MKKIIIFTFLTLVWLCSFAQNQGVQLKYKITGKMSGFKQKSILLERLTLDNSTVLDSVPYKNKGEFSFAGTATEPGLYRLRSGISLSSTILLVVSEKENNIAIDADSISVSNFTYNTSGSLATRQVRNILAEAISRYNTINSLSNQVHSEPNIKEEDKDKIFKQIDALASSNREYIYHFIDTIHNPIVAIFSTMSFLNPDQDFSQWDKVETRLKSEKASYSLAKEYISHTDQQREFMTGSHKEVLFNIGDTIPDIKLNDTTGKVITLSSLRGQYVLVDFWASWCGPCRAENPNVVQAYKQFHSKGFTVYSVSLDNDKKRWEKAIIADNLEWNTHVSELKGWQSSVCAQFGIESIPNNFLIDKKGKILGMGLRGEDLITQLNNALK